MKKRYSNLYRIISSFITFTFIFTSVIPPGSSYAQISTALINLPVPGTLVNSTTAFTPAIIRGVTINPNNPLEFTFSIDNGNATLSEDDFRAESQRLVKYFLASLTVPQKDLWVNLSPYESNRIVGDTLSHTEMGIDLLAQDYMLKQLTSSMIHPDHELGKTFWKRVRALTQDKFGTHDVPTDTFHKIWIVPAEAEIYEQGYSAHVVSSHLKVMLEDDYVALQSNAESRADLDPNILQRGISSKEESSNLRKPLVSENSTNETRDDFNSLDTQIMKEIILPAIEIEVNEGAIFANLRQIYNSMILAVWYKNNLQESLLSQVYADQNKIKGIDITNPEAKDEIYNQYVQAFKTGVYDFIKEEYDAREQKIVPKKYFSGGWDPSNADYASITADPLTLTQMSKWKTSAVTVALDGVTSESDAAELTKREQTKLDVLSLIAQRIPRLEAQNSNQTLQSLGITPGDNQYVDLVTFLADQYPNKREKILDRLNIQTRTNPQVDFPQTFEELAFQVTRSILGIKAQRGSRGSSKKQSDSAMIGTTPKGLILEYLHQNRNEAEGIQAERLQNAILTATQNYKLGIISGGNFARLINLKFIEQVNTERDAYQRTYRITPTLANLSEDEIHQIIGILDAHHTIQNKGKFLTAVKTNLAASFPDLAATIEVADAAMLSPEINAGYTFRYDDGEEISAQNVDENISDALSATNGVSPISSLTLKSLKLFIETEITEIPGITELLAELDIEPETIVEQIFGIVRPEEFDSIFSPEKQDRLLELLKKNGYLDKNRTLTEEFLSLDGSESLKLNDEFNERRVQIYNILRSKKDINLFQIQKDNSPLLAVSRQKDNERKYTAFQASRIKLTNNQRHIYLAKGILESLSKLNNTKLLNSFLLIEIVRLISLETILNNNTYESEEDAVAQANIYTSRLENLLVKKRLKVAFQSKTVRYLNPDVNKLTLGLSLKIDDIASKYGIVFDDRHTTLTTKVKQFIKRAVRTDISRSKPAIEELAQLIQANQTRLASWGIEPHEMEILDTLTQTGIYAGDNLSSFPAEEISAVNYLKIFRTEIFQSAAETLVAKFDHIDEELSHEELFDAINSAIEQVIMTPQMLAREALLNEKGQSYLRSQIPGESLTVVNAELDIIAVLSPKNQYRFIHDKEYALEIAPRIMERFLNKNSIERNTAVAPGSNKLMVHETLLDQVQNELRIFFYNHLLHFVNTGERNVLLNENTSRDGHQSNIGTNLTGQQQRAILRNSLRYGNLHRVETWGGAVPQVALLKDRRNGNPPEDPFYNLRQSTHILREYLIEVMDSFGLGKISNQTRQKLLKRYEFSIDRKIYEPAELDEILKETSLSTEEKEKLKTAYEIRQEMLLRGQYIVGLQPYPSTVLKKFIETSYKNGLDVFRIFDAFNDTRNIKSAIEYVRKLNEEHGASAKIQPVIHYTTDFPTGIDGYVQLALELVEASGDALDSLTIKDAGGLLEADEAYKLVKALRTAFNARGLTNIKLQLHTHDTRGNRQLTLLEAIRANGKEAPIVVDVASGNMAAPFAQPNIRQLTNIIRNTSWNKNKISDINEEALIANEELIRDYLKEIPILAITSAQRRGVTRGRLPGGMKSNFDPEIIKNIVIGLAPLIEKNFNIETTKDKLTLTADGKRFMDSIYELIFDEMIQITEDVGGISLVTPSSDWIGKQAIQNVFSWITNAKGPLIHFDRSSWTLSQNSELTIKSRAEQYAQAPLWAGLPNYLIERAQDREVLGKLYPNVNRGVVALAFKRSSGLADEDIEKYLDDEGYINPKALQKYEALRQALDDQSLGLTKPFVDTAVFKLYALIKSAGDADDTEARLAIETSTFPRSLIIRMAKKSEGLNIPLTLEEMKEEVSRFKVRGEKYSEITDTDEDLLLLALFPAEKQFIHLLEERFNTKQKYKRVKKGSWVQRAHERTLQRMSAEGFYTTTTETSDKASITEDNVGGIDLNSDMLNIKIKRDGNGMILPLPQQPIMNLNIEGFVPVIINVQPLNVPAMLGLLDNTPKPINVGYTKTKVDKLSYLTRDPNEILSE